MEIGKKDREAIIHHCDRILELTEDGGADIGGDFPEQELYEYLRMTQDTISSLSMVSLNYFARKEREAEVPGKRIGKN